MKNNFQKFFLKDGSKVNYYFLSMMMQRKKDLVRAVHNRKEPQRHLLEKNWTWKFCDEVLRISLEFPEKYFWEILRKFLRKIPEKFSGISRNLFSYLIPLKNRKLGDQVLRISQEFSEKYFGEFLRNFLGWNSEEIPRNF